MCVRLLMMIFDSLVSRLPLRARAINEKLHSSELATFGLKVGDYKCPAFDITLHVCTQKIYRFLIRIAVRIVFHRGAGARARLAKTPNRRS